MNICYFAPNVPYKAPHGGYSHTINICKALQNTGNNVVIVFQGTQFSEFKKQGLIIITIPTWTRDDTISILSMLETIPLLIKLIKICIKYQIDLIHIRSGLPRGIGIVAAKILRIKSITEINSPIIKQLEIKIEAPFRIWRKIMFKLTDKIITQTTLLKQFLSKDTNSNKIKIISNGVNQQLFNPNINGNYIRNKYKIHKDTILVIFVGAFHPWHGVMQIITIAEILKKENLNVKFLVVGKGPLFSIIQDKINKNKLNNEVILIGPVDHSEIPKYIASADIGIAPFSLSDYKPLAKCGFWWCPIKLFEYLAMGKPVISIFAGDIPKIVPHNRAGLLSPPNEFNQLIINLKNLISSKDLRQKLGSFGRNHIIKNYTWAKLADDMNKVYHNL